MLMAFVSQELVVEQKVANHSHVCALPVTVADWLKMPFTSPALTQIQIVIAIETCTEPVSMTGREIVEETYRNNQDSFPEKKPSKEIC